MGEKFYKVRTLPQNSYYQGLLLDLYSGSEGFLVNYLQFLYQYNQFADKNLVCESTFKQLLDCEFESIKILSDLLIVIGSDPKYVSSHGKFLSGKQVDYVKDLMQMILLDIENIEKNIIEIKGILQKIGHTYIKNQLKELLKFKQEELKILKNFAVEIKK